MSFALPARCVALVHNELGSCQMTVARKERTAPVVSLCTLRRINKAWLWDEGATNLHWRTPIHCASAPFCCVYIYVTQLFSFSLFFFRIVVVSWSTKERIARQGTNRRDNKQQEQQQHISIRIRGSRKERAPARDTWLIRTNKRCDWCSVTFFLFFDVYFNWLLKGLFISLSLCL